MRKDEDMLSHGHYEGNSYLDAASVAAALGGRRSGRGYLAPCPTHADVGPSLSIRDGDDGKVWLTCFAGCDRRDVWAAIKGAGIVASDVRAERVTPRRPPNNASARRIWDESRGILPSGPVYRYLSNRGIRLCQIPGTLRYHPSLARWEQDGDKWAIAGRHPAMVVRIDDPDGNFVTVHQTFLTHEGRKAGIQPAKRIKSTGIPLNGCAIRLFPVTDGLIIAEGVETALALHVMTGLPVWATISASLMKSLVLPASIQEVAIGVDLDLNGAGERAANELAWRLQQEGRRVKLMIPPGTASDKGIDWADVLGAQQ
ncbi:MAG TPA: toprim domain-containing protein [Candidatus Obscuribacterales bacterium]